MGKSQMEKTKRGSGGRAMIRRLLVLILLSLLCSGCAAAPAIALGTGSAVADAILGEAIISGAGAVAAEVAPKLVSTVLYDGGSVLDRVGSSLGSPLYALGNLIRPRPRFEVSRRTGLVFARGNW